MISITHTRLIGGALCALCLAAPPAIAQDFQQDWGGGYAGAMGSATMFSIDNSDLDNSFLSNAPTQSQLVGQFGVYGGYNYMYTPNLLLGAELNYRSAAEIDEFYSSNAAESTGTQYTTTLESIIGLKARVGRVEGNLLTYLSGGYASATTNFETYQVDTGGGRDDCDSSRCSRTDESIDGLSIGAGMEYAYRENIVIRFEVEHTAYENIQAPVTAADGSPACAAGDTDQCTVGYSPSTTAINLGVSYHF